MFFTSTRKFKLWDYNVSHKQLLIRSPATPELSGNIDVVFWQVEYVALATELSGISIDISTETDRVSLERSIGRTISSTLFCVSDAKHRYIVVAGGAKILSNNLDIGESTLVYFGIDRPDEWYGRVIAHSQ